MNKIAVYCGSSSGRDPIYKDAAFQLGSSLAQKGITVIYGGAKVGLMGAVADGALSEGGKVVGVIPDFLKTKEVAHDGLSKLIEVESMHVRKTKMNDLSDGIIALPGGFGTMEELFEMITWAQLGLHYKPIGILNIGGFYDSLMDQVQKMLDEQFIKTEHAELIIIENDILGLINKMHDFTPVKIPKWISDNQT